MAGIATGWMNKGIGLYQFIKGRKMEKEAGERPTYEIPEEIRANLTQAQIMAAEGLPAEQKRQYVENLQQAQGAAMAQLSSRKAGLVGAGQVAQTATEGYQNLLAMDAQARRENQMLAMKQGETMAEYRDLQWKTNEFDPWTEQTAYARALQGAGIQNVQLGQAQDETAFREVVHSILGAYGIQADSSASSRLPTSGGTA